MADNWIEQKARVERMSKEGSPRVWLDAVAAVEDSCASFTTHYPEPMSIDIEKQNGHRLRITVMRTDTIPRAGRTTTVVGVIDIAFDAKEPRINVMHGEKVTHFVIGSDQDHAFLTHKNEPLDADGFARLVLEDILFPRTTGVASKTAWKAQGGSHTAWS